MNSVRQPLNRSYVCSVWQIACLHPAGRALPTHPAVSTDGSGAQQRSLWATLPAQFRLAKADLPITETASPLNAAPGSAF